MCVLQDEAHISTSFVFSLYFCLHLMSFQKSDNFALLPNGKPVLWTVVPWDSSVISRGGTFSSGQEERETLPKETLLCRHLIPGTNISPWLSCHLNLNTSAKAAPCLYNIYSRTPKGCRWSAAVPCDPSGTVLFITALPLPPQLLTLSVLQPVEKLGGWYKGTLCHRTGVSF